MIFTEPTSLGRLSLKNRFVMAPVKTAYGTPDGRVTERHLTYYSNVARGGAGLVIIEPVAVTQEGKEHPKQLTIHLSTSVVDLRRIVDVIHAQDGQACLNLNHAGRAANPKATGTTPLAPSALTCPATGQTPVVLTTAHIEEILHGYRAAVKRAAEAGFDAVEIQAGHGYLVSQFLSARTNNRDDEYGKDRTLFLRELFDVIAQERGDLAVLVRISMSELVEGGLTPADNRPILELAEQSGFDAVHCGMGNACDTPPWYYAHMAVPEAKQLEALEAIRRMTKLPVIAAGRMASPEKLARLEREGLADFAAFGRPLVADPELPNKLSEGRESEVVWCGYCLQGCLANVKNGSGLGCVVNPAVDQHPVTKVAAPLKVAVVGAGPAGMSAATTAALAGHAVTLFEQSAKLGGLFSLAPLAPHKGTMTRPLRGQIARARRLVPDIRLETRFTVADAGRYDHVIVAAGAGQRIPEIEGLGDQHWMTSLDFFQDSREVTGPRVLVIGAGMVGMEAAELLVDRGYEVVATKRSDTIANDMELVTKKLMLKRLEGRGELTLLPETTVLAFESEGVRVERRGQEERLEPFDTVIVASGMVPERGLAAKLRDAGVSFTVVGDADHSADIHAATRSGYLAALNLS